MLIRGMRVFDCHADTTTAILLSAMDFIGTQGIKPAVVNMSFGGLASDALDAGAKALWDKGFFVAASAGNSEDDTCGRSPARAVYAVAASGLIDRPAYFTSSGPCVDIYAPGVDITSLGTGGGYFNGDGTSAAASFVAGAAALYKEMFGEAASDTIAEWLNTNATVDAVAQNVPPTPNRLLFLGPGLPPGTPEDSFGYVFANQPSEAFYIPSPLHQRSLSVFPNRVTRSGPGTYRVHAPGAVAGGIAQAASAGGSSGPACQPTGDSAQSGEHVIDVRCFGADGQPSDGTRSMLGTVGARGHARIPGNTFNSEGGPVTVRRSGTGNYEVTFGNLGGSTPGHVMVAATGTTTNRGRAVAWANSGPDQRVAVQCRTTGGQPDDAEFNVHFVW